MAITYNELKVLVKSNFNENPAMNFAEVAETTRSALAEFYELGEMTPREIRRNKIEIMALIEEVIDELMPEKLQSRVQEFAEVKQYARNAEVIFHIKGIGKRRAFLTIKKGQRGGLYQAARLDDKSMTVDTWTETVGVFVTLEEILLGKYSLQELMNNILDGFVEKLYKEVIEAMQALYSSAPAANTGTASGWAPATVDPIIRIVAAYGSPIIVGFHNVLSQINNSQFITSSNPNTPQSDLDELKDKGYIGKYKGTPIVKLPNYIINEVTNAEWLLTEQHVFILPAGAKPVKVALKGEMQLREVEHPTGSVEWNAHKMLGVAVLLNNNVGVYLAS